jgi:hypothetical protein
MSNDYPTDRAWADTFETQVLSILKILLPYVVVLSVASIEADTKRATDFEIKLRDGTIAVRVRRMEECSERDLTIRSRRKDNIKTELAKIKEGHASRYFYAWADAQDIIIDREWMLVDLDKVRSMGLLEKPRKEIPNKDKEGKPDGTAFIYISYHELRKNGCILAFQGLEGIQRIQVKKSLIPSCAARFIVPPAQLPLFPEVRA